MRHLWCLPTVLFFTQILCAQQAIINMPSADITPKGKFFLMHETQTRWWGDKPYWYGTNFFAYGVGKSTELAITSYNSGSPATPNFATGFGFKSAPQLFKESLPHSEIKLTFGQMGIINHRAKGFGSFTYSHISGRVPGAHTRISVGGYAGTRQLFKRNTGGVIASFEQPFMHEKIIVVTEWFSGRNDFGFAIPGIVFQPKKGQFIVAGYKIPNYQANGPSGWVFEYGITF